MQNISITIEEAKTALDCVLGDIQCSEFSTLDFNDVEDMRFYLRRAELKHRLENAIENIEGEKQ